MKIRPKDLTQPQIFEGGYEHPWYKHINKPNPPTKEEIEKAKFVDKTYHWSGDNRIRSRNKRSPQ